MLDRIAGGCGNPMTHEDLDAGRHFLQMDGRNVFKWAVRAVTDSVEVVRAKNWLVGSRRQSLCAASSEHPDHQ